MTAAVNPLRRSDLYYAAEYDFTVSGVFQFADSVYTIQFDDDAGLTRWFDAMLSFPEMTGTPRLHLRPANYEGDRPEWPLSNLRFDIDRGHGVAAAVLLALDKAEVSHTWMTRGSAAQSGVELTHDSWNPDDKRFPPESFVTIDELRDVVRQWAFGDVLPPPVVPWVTVPHESVGWF
jgi:hypothetical protein